MKHVNEDVIRLAAQLGANAIGSTLTAIVFIGDQAMLLHAGDSRAYHIRAGQACQISTDQTYAQQLVDDGKLDENMAEYREYSSVLTSFLGTENLRPQIEMLNLIEGDTLVICSDGVFDRLSTQDIATATLETLPSLAAEHLVQFGAKRIIDHEQEHGNRHDVESDNMSAVVIRWEKPIQSA